MNSDQDFDKQKAHSVADVTKTWRRGEHSIGGLTTDFSMPQ